MSECLASKRAKKNNADYTIRQATIEISQNDRQELKNNLDKYLSRI